MIRLGALLLATLAGLFVILSVWGDGNLRADRRPVPPPQPAALDAGAASPAVPEPQATPAAAVVQAESQTPEQVQRFPGPMLQPSPEYAGETPEPVAVADGPVLYVTGDRVNVRAGPSTGDRVVTALERGTGVQALGPQDGEWVNVRDADGRTGYVAGRFLSATAP
jgi:hypothetical protein